MSTSRQRIAEKHSVASARHVATRSVVMVTSPGREETLGDVASNLAAVCGETGQRVALVSTAGLSSPGEGGESLQSAALWWKHWPSPGSSDAASTEVERGDLRSGPLHPDDVEDLLGDTGITGVSRLDLRYFIGHPSQVVTRLPDVLDALRQVVDVVILEVPSYLSVHHGEGLTPMVDAVLVVGEREHTTIDEVKKTSAALRHLGAPVVGMALTGFGEEADLWGADSGFEEDGEERGEDDHPTAQIPVTVDHEATSEDELMVEHAAPEG